MLLRERARQFRVRAMAGLDRDHVAAKRPPEKSKVTDDIKDLVPDELIRKAQWFLAQDRFASNDNRVLEAAALDQILLHQRLDVFVINEGARRCDLAFVNRRSNRSGKELSEASIWSGLGAG